MRLLLITLLIGFCSLVKAQYPSPLPSSGELKMSQVITWMTAAGQLNGTTPPYTLSLLHSKSTLTTSDIKLSNWYSYRVMAPVEILSGELIEGESQAQFACQQPLGNVYYLEHGTTLYFGNTVYFDANLTAHLTYGYFKIENNQWVRVDNNGVIIEIGNCL